MICWQYLVKKRKEAEGGGYVPIDDWNEIDIRKVDYQDARRFILDYEWLGNMGAANQCYGLFIDGCMASVACYAPPVSPVGFFRMLGEDVASSLLQLCRGASTYWAPKWGPSKLISQSLRLISGVDKAKAVIAYADPEAGEVGIIYQACNAIYIGLSDPGGAKRYIINGRSYHPRTVYRKFGSRSRDHLLKIDPDYKTKPISAKHRYLFPLGTRTDRRKLLERIDHLVKPYPKREICE